ncbi:hypothetical protein E6P09_14015 [Haloferax mediterranei ATCC 33500]|uniref:DUF6199 domain-containing protein n=1 Tax=Haloferax mediterranei (strain ATCC 33500 / DSM 1411 / JCM 8866 / NBRC 14739 / NCIMB 2177 / R-4) TaxID=523841 RepID=I3R7M4_HALMT|nr:hypothetical protein [Haloferax mediterranei]AFK20234.1 hypothetical protein HFX_2553 [Haloferax mediterranei ATCC 33500]AHZ23604.1 hypothetical protein BM92_13570 [Haloferax mediterranei ATCC 33500]ELZ99089.1 hypothetical protein C439_14559 [Haloferax mediterranei ATCC 33500]MDX5987014.1 hypothetical protein [Haloferax mediterranei ATCC 33500]QCQ76331.1 hypothetical protein E6P09_14015 [Haloferax mediterranei ATCC 33500]
MDIQTVLFGLLAITGGVITYRYAYGITKFGEQLDAIGSKTHASEVEPAAWNVTLTKLMGLFFVALGLFFGGAALVSG